MDSRRRMIAVLGLALLSGGLLWSGSGSALKEPLEIPTQADGNKMSVQIELDGSPLWAVLDTGAPAPIVLLLHDDLPRQSGWTSVGEYPLGGAGGGPRSRADVFAGIKVGVAGLEFPGQRALAIPKDHAFSQNTSAAGWEAVIGGILFNRFVVEQDYSQARTVLHLREGFQAPDDAVELPLTIGPAGHIFIDTQLRLQGGELRPVRLVVDSGAGHALSLQADASQGIGPPEKSLDAYLGRGLSGELRGKIGRLAELHLGGHVLRDVVTSFPEAGQMPNLGKRNGNLGMGALRRFVTWYDFAGKRMFLRPGPDYREPFGFTATGLLLNRHAEGYKVVQVLDGSPAQESGITDGQILTAVNGNPTKSMRQDDLNRLLKQPGSTLTLTFGTENKQQPVTLTTREIL